MLSTQYIVSHKLRLSVFLGAGIASCVLGLGAAFGITFLLGNQINM